MKYSFRVEKEAQVEDGDVFQLTLTAEADWFDRLLGRKGYSKSILVFSKGGGYLPNVLEGAVSSEERDIIHEFIMSIHESRYDAACAKAREDLAIRCKAAIQGGVI